jgi:hypothetical protein
LMGQNVVAELSGACLESRRADRLTGNVGCDQRLGFWLRLFSNFSYCLASLRQISAIRKDKGSAIAQMPTRPSFSSLLVRAKEVPNLHGFMLLPALFSKCRGISSSYIKPPFTRFTTRPLYLGGT